VAGRGKNRGFLGPLALSLRLGTQVVNGAHGVFDLGGGLAGCQLVHVVLGGQLDVGAEAIGVSTRAGQQLGRRAGRRLEVDVATKPLVFPQGAGHLGQLLHGVIGALDDAR
jgi:hypothetical protein